jgi:hypothetical protein
LCVCALSLSLVSLTHLCASASFCSHVDEKRLSICTVCATNVFTSTSVFCSGTGEGSMVASARVGK